MILEPSVARNLKKLLDFLKPENVITTAQTSDKLLVYDNADNSFKSIQISDLLLALDISTRSNLSDGTTPVNYNNLINYPNLNITILYDHPNFSYNGFNVTHSNKSIYIDGKIRTISGTTINLSQVISNPANKTLYCYIGFDGTAQAYVFKFYEQRQGVSSNFVEVATLTTNSTTVTQTIYKQNFYWINGYSLSNDSEAYCIPVTNASGKISENFIPPNITVQRYSTTTTVGPNSHNDFFLDQLFPNTTQTHWQRVRAQVYLLDITPGSPTSGLYIYPDTTSTVAISQDYRMVSVYNFSSNDRTYQLNIII